MSFNKAFKLIEILEEAGFEAKVAGGPVRDYLMGKTPSDIDIATTAKPFDVMNTFRKKKFSVIPTGISHGTVTVLVDKEPFEITTLRSDIKTDGRFAEVEFHEDWKSDSDRRDFTINSIFMNPDFSIVDFNGGETDIKNRIIRFVGDADSRIQEDYLRILRLFRFKARLGFTVPESDLKAVQRNAKGLERVSKERILSEVLKIVQHRDVQTFVEMNETGVSEVIFGQKLTVDSFIGHRGVMASLHTLGVTSEWLVKNKASNAQRAELRKIENFAFFDLHYDVWKNGKEFVEMMIELLDINIPDVPDEPSVEFPINGWDLKNLGFVGHDIKEKLHFLQIEWAKSEFKKTKEDLLQLVKGS